MGQNLFFNFQNPGEKKKKKLGPFFRINFFFKKVYFPFFFLQSPLGGFPPPFFFEFGH